MPAAKATPLHRPNLAGVINPDDLFKKKATTMWRGPASPTTCTPRPMAGSATCAALLMAPTSGKPPMAPATWCCISGPDGQVTADFPYAITNQKSGDQAGADRFRHLCNAQRRGFAACAAFTFWLGYELGQRRK